MKIDSYTKAVLTVIALCLVWLCVNGTTAAVSAQPDAQRVVVVGWDRPLPAMIVDQKGTPLVTDQSLRVTLTNQPVAVSFGGQTMPVAIKSIERDGSWQPIQVEVMKAPGSLYPGK